MSVPASTLYETVAPHVGEAGTCDEAQFLRALNQALDLIWPMGDWEGTIVRCRLPVDSECCVRLPWQIEKVRTAWFGKKLAPVNDHLYEGLVADDLISCGDCVCPRLINTGISRPLPVDIGYPTYLAVQFGPEAAGTKVTLTYLDANGVSRRFDAIAEEGAEARFRFVTPEPVYGLLMVSKPKTQNPVLMLSCPNSSCSTWNKVAYYHPTQINPSYSVVKIVGVPAGATILVRAKLRRPVITSMEDPVPIENAHALALAVRAVAYLGRNRDAYVATLKDATDLLKIEALDEMDNNGTIVEADVPVAMNLMPRY